jgi:hypothetical protein
MCKINLVGMNYKAVAEDRRKSFLKEDSLVQGKEAVVF